MRAYEAASCKGQLSLNISGEGRDAKIDLRINGTEQDGCKDYALSASLTFEDKVLVPTISSLKRSCTAW